MGASVGMRSGKSTYPGQVSTPRPAAADAPAGWVIARVAGVPIVVGPSWLIVAAAITFLFAPAVSDRMPNIGSLAYVISFAFAVLLWAGVLIHELAHTLVARAYGMRVLRISLHLMGGVSEIETEPNTPAKEFWIAVAGPVASLVLGGGCLALLPLLADDSVAWILVWQMGIANLLVGAFNLIPGLPLDGGRLLRAGVWAVTRDPIRGTLVAAWGGRVTALLVVALPFLLDRGRPSTFSLIWGVMLGFFIWQGAEQSLRAARFRSRLPNLEVARLVRPAIAVVGDMPLAMALAQLQQLSAGAIVVLDGTGKPSAVVSEAAVSATPVERRPWVPVSSLARSLEPELVLDLKLDGEALLGVLRNSTATEFLVLGPQGTPAGVLVRSDVDKALAGMPG